MPWLISQFPELDHLEPAQRAHLLGQVPCWIYPRIAGRAAIGGLLVAGITVYIVETALRAPLSELATLVLYVLIAITAGAGLYHRQLKTVRRIMRHEIALGFQGQRPPFCFACGYDLRGSTAVTCTECGKAI